MIQIHLDETGNGDNRSKRKEDGNSLVARGEMKKRGRERERERGRERSKPAYRRSLTAGHGVHQRSSTGSTST